MYLYLIYPHVYLYLYICCIICLLISLLQFALSPFDSQKVATNWDSCLCSLCICICIFLMHICLFASTIKKRHYINLNLSITRSQLHDSCQSNVRGEVGREKWRTVELERLEATESALLLLMPESCWSCLGEEWENETSGKRGEGMNILSSVASSVSLTCVWILPFLLLFVAAYASRTRRLGVNHHEYLLLWEREVFYPPIFMPLSFFPSLITVLPVKRYITAFSWLLSPPLLLLLSLDSGAQLVSLLIIIIICSFCWNWCRCCRCLKFAVVVVCKWSNVSLSLTQTHTQANENIFSYCVQVSRCCSILHTERWRRRTTRTTVVGPHWMVS